MSIEELIAKGGPLVTIDGEPIYILCSKCDAAIYWWPSLFFVSETKLASSICSECATPTFTKGEFNTA